MSVLLINGNALKIPLADKSVQCVITSPPYYGLRNYEVDGQLGLEKTPEEYVNNLVLVFREVKRVLRDDGTVWLNLGDSYNGSGGPGSQYDNKSAKKYKGEFTKFDNPNKNIEGLKPKDLIGIPWSVAKALQAPFYTGKIKNELDRVWLAAMIDSEGSICGFTHKRVDTGKIRNGINITITNSNLALLDKCFNIWHTTREEHNIHSEGHFGHLPIWRWIVHGVDEKSNLLRELYPYLIAKKKQALLAWNYLEISRTTRGRNKGVEGIENREKYQWVVNALSSLNHLENIDIPFWCKEPPTLYEDGWYLRSDIIWKKTNPMPESVKDRPTRAHEYLFLLTKSQHYFYDADAIKEPNANPTRTNYKPGKEAYTEGNVHDNSGRKRRNDGFQAYAEGKNCIGRNRRTVWTIATKPYRGAHFATYPPELVEPCIKAGTSEKGCCPICGSPWKRISKKTGQFKRRWSTNNAGGSPYNNQDSFQNIYETIGWEPSCDHNSEPIPCVVLDPFNGSGTTGEVSVKLGRSYVGIELKMDYIELSKKRIEKVKVE